MSLNKPNLINDLLEMFETEAVASDSPAESRQRMAQKLADAIDRFVKSGEVNVAVTTSGTATNQTGTGTGNIT